ncbi:MFS transporter [Vibrio celticus]|uniref:MFS transporter n=1 Tax=Vibrio celticus TaxID=446372 RepID=UPI00406978CA
MKLAFYLVLISLGINQTLVVAAIPSLSGWLEASDINASMGGLVLAVNMNLASYWLGASRWGAVVSKLGFTKSFQLAAFGYAFSCLTFVALILGDVPNLLLLGGSRFLIGAFSCAFLPLSQTLLATRNDATPAALSRLSSALTLGRLVGPSLVFLPMEFGYLLLLPIVMVLPLFFTRCDAGQWKKNVNSTSKKYSIKPMHYFAFTAALLTTALVAVFQFFVLQFLSLHGYQGEKGTDIYASLMLATSILLVVYQLRFIPSLSQRQSNHFMGILLSSLIIGSATLVMFGMNWWGLGGSLVWLLLAVAGLPAWYTARLLQSENDTLMQSKLSGYLTRAYTSGHILGTGFAALFLNQQWLLSILIGLISVSLIYCVLRLNSSSELEQAHTY